MMPGQKPPYTLFSTFGAGNNSSIYQLLNVTTAQCSVQKHATSHLISSLQPYVEGTTVIPVL